MRAAFAAAIIVATLVTGCSTTESASDQPVAAAAGPCADEVAKAAEAGTALDDAVKACSSLDDWLAAWEPYPEIYPDGLAVDIAVVHCMVPELSGYSLCQTMGTPTVALTFEPQIQAPAGPQVAIDPAYQEYWAEKTARERAERKKERKDQRKLEQRRKQAELERKEAERKRVARQRAERSLGRYGTSALNTYSRDVRSAVQRMYSANMAVTGFTREERQARHSAMDKIRIPAVSSINKHLTYMASNPARGCPGDLYRVDRALANQWLGLLVRGNYPSTLTGEGRSVRLEYDAALKRTNTFLRDLDTRIGRCG